MIEFFILVMIVVAIVMAITSDRRPVRGHRIIRQNTPPSQRPIPQAPRPDKD